MRQSSGIAEDSFSCGLSSDNDQFDFWLDHSFCW